MIPLAILVEEEHEGGLCVCLTTTGVPQAREDG
jgi:hypothetical protein